MGQVEFPGELSIGVRTGERRKKLSCFRGRARRRGERERYKEQSKKGSTERNGGNCIQSFVQVSEKEFFLMQREEKNPRRDKKGRKKKRKLRLKRKVDKRTEKNENTSGWTGETRGKKTCA